jgi:hypothetical protein
MYREGWTHQAFGYLEAARVASTVGGKGIAVDIELADPEQVRIVLGPVQGVQQRARQAWTG